MRRALAGILIGACAVIPVGIYSLVQVTTGDSDRNAGAQLAALSLKSLAISHSVRYATVPGRVEVLVAHRDPDVGVRFDFLVAPSEVEKEQQSEILKSGDSLIGSNGGIISCRTARETCRSADGLERLRFVALTSAFMYPEAFVFDQPHSVRRIDPDVVAGVSATCFHVDVRLDVTPPAGLGIVAGKGLPLILCYSDDGIPLRWIVEEFGKAVEGLEAVAVDRTVDPSVFEPPFPVVASIYDD